MSAIAGISRFPPHGTEWAQKRRLSDSVYHGKQEIMWGHQKVLHGVGFDCGNNTFTSNSEEKLVLLEREELC